MNWVWREEHGDWTLENAEGCYAIVWEGYGGQWFAVSAWDSNKTWRGDTCEEVKEHVIVACVAYRMEHGKGAP